MLEQGNKPPNGHIDSRDDEWATLSGVYLCAAETGSYTHAETPKGLKVPKSCFLYS